MKPHRGKDGQIHHRHRRALHQQAIGSARIAQAPAQNQESERACRHAQIAQLDRHDHPIRGIAQQESQADEHQHHAHAHQGVAAEQPILRGGKSALQQARLFRLGRDLHAHRRFRLPFVDHARGGLDFGCGLDRRGGLDFGCGLDRRGGLDRRRGFNRGLDRGRNCLGDGSRRFRLEIELKLRSRRWRLARGERNFERRRRCCLRSLRRRLRRAGFQRSQTLFDLRQLALKAFLLVFQQHAQLRQFGRLVLRPCALIVGIAPQQQPADQPAQRHGRPWRAAQEADNCAKNQPQHQSHNPHSHLLRRVDQGRPTPSR